MIQRRSHGRRKCIYFENEKEARREANDRNRRIEAHGTTVNLTAEEQIYAQACVADLAAIGKTLRDATDYYISAFRRPPAPTGDTLADKVLSEYSRRVVAGFLSLQEMRSDLPKFGTNNRQEGTADENKAIVQGSICYFGTYTIDEAAKTLIFHLEGCSFPNWNGTEQKRSFTLTGDELTWTGVGSSGRPIHTLWKRAK